MAKLKSLDFITYDLEWWSSCSKDCKAHIDHPEHVHNYAHPEDGKLRLVGVFDERKGYRKYLTMEKFIKGELHEGNYERVFFAHAGGKYDFQYVFEELVKKGFAQNRYHIEAIFNGASAFLVTLKERKWRGRFQFSDSVFLLKGTLKQIGEKLGPDWHKGDVDFNTNDFEALVTYNEQDCRVLFEGLKRLQTELRGLGGEMRPTLASSAMLLFHSRYLRTPLRTYYPNGEEVRKAYYASRVEVFRPRSQGGFHYDINSSFPWSMTQTLPGQYKGSSLHLPDDPCATPVIAELTVTVPDEFLTPVPFRDNTERILFPTGTWRAYFGGPDIRLMLREGCTIEKVHKVLHYETFYDLTGYVEEMYQLKATEKGFKRDVYKLLLNALYGKFGERPFKEKLVIFPKSSRCPHDPKHEQDECMRMIRPNYYMRRDFMDLEHVHVPIPVFVTAYSRELLYNYMKKCKLFYYVDTDSIDTGPEDVLETSDTDLGALKLEIVVKAAEFISPKLYRITKEDDTTLIKSKGFSKLSDETFEGLLRGESIPLNRQRSIRESIRKGIFEPGRTLVEKRILMKRMKRCMDMKANTSRAWTMKEILQEAAT
jgi:hypothetical protein